MPVYKVHVFPPFRTNYPYNSITFASSTLDHNLNSSPYTQVTATAKKATAPKAVSKAVLNTTSVVEAPKVTETPKVEAPAPAALKPPADITKLRGFDFVVLPLIYLEAFVVNILQNAGLKVPDRVAVQ